MSDLEGDESTTKRKGLKILTPNQMLSKLPISLAQLNSGNNSLFDFILINFNW